MSSNNQTNFSEDILVKIDDLRFGEFRQGELVPTREEMINILVEKAFECRAKETGKKVIKVEGGVKIL